MSRNDVTQDVVLQRIVARLRDQINLNDRQCYDTLDPEEPPNMSKGGKYFITVGIGEGRFVDGEQTPGNVTEESDILVVGWTRIKLDAVDHGSQMLRDVTRGLLPLKLKILKALVGHDLATSSGDTMLRTLLYATNAPRPRYVRDKQIGFIALTFATDFDWDLT